MRARKTLNKPLLRKLALKLRRLRHEEHFNQGAWAQQTTCGTAACIAGHVVLMAGYKLDLYPGDIYTDYCRPKGRNAEDSEGIDVVATRVLGLNSKQADALFDFDYNVKAPTKWPAEYLERWQSGHERHSRIAADLLDAIADGKVKP